MGQTLEHLAPPPRFSRLRMRMLILLGSIAIVLANSYSLLITNHGLLLSHIFPELHFFDRVLPETWATFMFATVLQLGIMVLYFTVAVARAGHKSYVLPFLIVLVAISFYFGYLSVHSNARGAAYVSAIEQRIDGAESAIQGELDHMAADVGATLQSYRALAEDARKGQDKSGLAGCGPICQGYYEAKDRVARSFSHLLEPPHASIASREAAVEQRWATLGRLYAGYRERRAEYSRFLASEQRPDERDAAAASIDTEVAALDRIFETGRTDRLSLTSDSLGAIRQDREVMVSALISILPDVINLAMALALIALRRTIAPRLPKSRLPRRRQPPQLAPLRQEPFLSPLPALESPEVMRARNAAR